MPSLRHQQGINFHPTHEPNSPADRIATLLLVVEPYAGSCSVCEPKETIPGQWPPDDRFDIVWIFDTPPKDKSRWKFARSRSGYCPAIRTP
jgi:hypothetical protein